LPVTTVESKGNPHPFAVVTGDLEAVGTPASVALLNGYRAVVATRLRRPTGVSGEQQGVFAHDPVGALRIDPWLALGFAPAVHQGASPPVAIRRQVGNFHPQFGQQEMVIDRLAVFFAGPASSPAGLPSR
jgi:hypothetical protein